VGGGRTGHLSDADLVACVDGDPDAERRRRIETHLRACPECERRLAEFRAVGGLLRKRYPLVDDPGAREAIVAKSAEVEPRPGRDRDRASPLWRTLAGAWMTAVNGASRVGRSVLRRLRSVRRNPPPA
jgi:anti-sigma factor RsiW